MPAAKMTVALLEAHRGFHVLLGRHDQLRRQVARVHCPGGLSFRCACRYPAFMPAYIAAVVHCPRCRLYRHVNSPPLVGQ
jgi:hypothetical protein